MKNRIVILGLINENNRHCLEALASEGYQVDTLTLIDNVKPISSPAGSHQQLYVDQSTEPSHTLLPDCSAACGSIIQTVLIIVDTGQCVEVVDDFYDATAKKIPVLALIHSPVVYQDRERLYDNGVLDCIVLPLIVHELLFKVKTVLHYSRCIGVFSDDNLCLMNNASINNAQVAYANSSIKQSDKQLVTDTCQYLLTHIDQKLNLDDVAITMGANRSKLAAVFKQVIGYGVFEWLREQRMLKARSLLMNSEMSIQAIGFEVGYENSANFSTVYKKHFDISPRQQRKSVKHEILTHSNLIHT